MLREDEFQTGLAEPLDEIDDLAPGVAHDVAHARVAQALPDDPANGRHVSNYERSEADQAQNRLMRRIGHRGAMGHAPENTIASFAAALALGCDEVETDVWLVPGGRLVISHDPPTADAATELATVLDFCRGRMAVNVELKSAGSDTHAFDTGRSVGAYLAARADPDVYVSSFWWPALAAARATAPAGRRAFLFCGSPDRAALLASARALELWALHPEYPYVTPELVAAAHGAGLRVNTWTVDDPRQIAALKAWDVDGVMSNYPERIPKD